MKKVMLAFILAFTVQPIFGQKCVTKTDAFTNEPVSSYEWRARGLRALYFESTKGVNIFEFRGAELGAIEYTVQKGSEVLIKLENGEIIKLATTDDAKSTVASTKISESENLTYSEYYLKMQVDPEQLKKLASFKITDLRYPDLHGGSKSFNDKDLRNKFQKFMMEGASCVLGSK